MPAYRRVSIAGGTYFFTVVTFKRQPLLTEDEIRQALREGTQNVRQSMPFTIEAWVLLPDHLHGIWTLPEADANYQARWAVIKRAVTRRYTRLLTNEQEKYLVRKTHPTFAGHVLSVSMQKRQEGGFWQRRFWEHVIRDDEDFRRHMDYLHFNPVKHGYVKNVADWPYSTFHRLVEQGYYSSNWGGDNCLAMQEKDFGE